MVPFQIEVELSDKPVNLWVEQLDKLSDEYGRIRYDVRENLRQAIIVVDIEIDPNSQDFTFEAVQAVDEFSGDEMLLIIKAIREFNHEMSLRFNRLPFTN